MSLENLFRRDKPVFGIRAAHLDMKGVPPTAKRLAELPALLTALRYNAVVVEWEDMFPWTVDPRIRCEVAYTSDDVKAFIDAAAAVNLEVIPLVQCLGHMEFALKFDDRAAMREDPKRIDCLNPLVDGARELVQSLVDDVLALTPGAKHFHLGGDEAWAFGSAPETKTFVDAHGKGALYLHHVGPILESLSERGIRPMLWHDMMCQWDSEALRDMGKRADLVVWSYNTDPFQAAGHASPEIMKRLADHGVTLWGASAYKGADGSNVDLPVVSNRVTNALAWAEAAATYGLKGIMTTAWSRYNHVEVQCEPIEGALDSLAAHGVIYHEGELPEGGLDACVEALGELGERERFEKAKAALSALSACRKDGWRTVQQIREEAVMIRVDKPRRASAWLSLGQLKKEVAAAREAGQAVTEALEGLVEPLWVQRYLQSRIDSLATEAEDIERILNEVSS